MPLLAEYALTPDVFDETCYGDPELCAVQLQALKDVLLNEALVSDLRSGDWRRVFVGDARPWHRRAKELLKKLISQRRLCERPPAAPTAPSNDSDWCDEALASHDIQALDGIIISDSLGPAYKGRPMVAPMGKLHGASWWASRSPSIRLERTLADYRLALDLVICHANSIMVIDPYLDPTRGFRDLVTILELAAGRNPSPLIELHRVAWTDGRDKRPQNAEIEGFMRAGLVPATKRTGLEFEVFLWDDFHDRYLISDLVGILAPHGFDTTKAANTRTTWSRLGRKERDDVQREFDRASKRHVLRHRFTVAAV